MSGRGAGEHTPCADLLPGGRDADDDALAPALVAGLERAAHHVHVAGAVERVVAPAVRHVDELFLDALVAELGRIEELGRAKLLGPRLFGIVDVDGDDLGRAVGRGALDHAEPDAAGAKDGHVGTFLDAVVARRDDGGAVARRDAAAEQAGAVHGRVGRLDGHDRDVGDDGELRKR